MGYYLIFLFDFYFSYVKIYTCREGSFMKNINVLRKMSYYKLKSQYYQLLYSKEVEQACFNENFEKAKETSNLYITTPGHDEENLKIYDIEVQLLKYCKDNLKERKRLDNEINYAKVKMLNAEKKL